MVVRPRAALASPAMKHALLLVNRTLLTLLGLATGAVKIAQMADEMAIFADAGFSTGATVGFGVVQLLAALALVHARSARAGASVLLLSFVVATGVLFVNAMVAFGVFSLLFIAMAAIVIAEPEVGAPIKGRAAAASSPAAR